jgi:predicted enzyme related to lactoylglutathione lyase
MAIRWTTAFWDYPADGFEHGTAFWLKVTDSTLSPRRGPDDEFATLIPSGGDPFLRVQEIKDGKGGNHLDLHVDDVEAETERARTLGAAVVHEEPGLTVLTSPGGFGFCLVGHDGEASVPMPVTWPDGHQSRPDQICVDIPPQAFDHELAFWHSLTGWPQSRSDTREFRRLLPPPELPLHFLLQRLESAEKGQTATAHMDLSCSDVDAEAERHVELGAERGERFANWQVMRDPGGLTYCITAKHPDGSWRELA